MLYEVKKVRQVRGEGFKRWFTDDYFDLFVHYTRKGGPITGFELSYDKENIERIVTWDRSAGFTHRAVDSGETAPHRFKMSPILVADGAFEKEAVAERFKREAAKIESSLASLVYGVLLKYKE